MPGNMLKSVSLAALLVLLAVPQVVHAQASSLFIEDLTWEEVAAALKAGKTTALIYTGGGEQNGLIWPLANTTPWHAISPNGSPKNSATR